MTQKIENLFGTEELDTSKDKGVTHDIFVTLGASNHTERERERNDFYATEPKAIDYLLEGGAEINKNVWECCCGQGHLAERLKEHGYNVKATDLIDRGYGTGGVDFLQQAEVLFVDLQEKYTKACGNSLDNWRNYIVDGVDDIVVSNE